MVPWDPTLTTASGRQPVQNNGCPEGYFAQFVAPGEPGSIAVPGKSYALRCRLMTTSSAQTIQEESGISAREALEIYTGAVADTLEQGRRAAARAFSWTPWLVGGGVVVGLLVLLVVVRR